jgi:glucosylceramidase
MLMKLRSRGLLIVPLAILGCSSTRSGSTDTNALGSSTDSPKRIDDSDDTSRGSNGGLGGTAVTPDAVGSDAVATKTVADETVASVEPVPANSISFSTDTSGSGEQTTTERTTASAPSETPVASGDGVTSGEVRPRPPVSSALATSVNGVWTMNANWVEAPDATVDVTVDASVERQHWEGFGGAFEEMGWAQLSTSALQTEAMELLFGADGAHLALARIPIGASDYALERYTLDRTETDVVLDGELTRPAADFDLANFSIERDKQTLIPYIKAALTVNPELRFWAVPWTPPLWMKTGYKQDSGSGVGDALRPSYFDGGTMKSDALTLGTYARYLLKFIQAYHEQGITIDMLAPQNQPTFDANYPSCLWEEATYVNFIGQFLAPMLLSEGLSTKILLGMLANFPNDSELVTATMEDALARSAVGAIGVEWNLLGKLQATPVFAYDVPLWVTEQRCGNYPFITDDNSDTGSGPPVGAYVEPAPNDQAYGEETWWYIREALTKVNATAYNLPHMVLDVMGKGNDTTRQWAQDSLLVVDAGQIKKTQAYYVVRHFSQFVDPGATVVEANGGDALAFKNPDGSLVTVMYSPEARSDYTVAIGGKKLQFSIPAGGWATVKYVP